MKIVTETNVHVRCLALALALVVLYWLISVNPFGRRWSIEELIHLGRKRIGDLLSLSS
jgi:hypothetical protein